MNWLDGSPLIFASLGSVVNAAEQEYPIYARLEKLSHA